MIQSIQDLTFLSFFDNFAHFCDVISYKINIGIISKHKNDNSLDEFGKSFMQIKDTKGPAQIPEVHHKLHYLPKMNGHLQIFAPTIDNAIHFN